MASTKHKIQSIKEDYKYRVRIFSLITYHNMLHCLSTVSILGFSFSSFYLFNKIADNRLAFSAYDAFGMELNPLQFQTKLIVAGY